MIPVPHQAFGHPRGIFVLFLVEMWERFSYYGMRALLIFYLTDHFLFGDARSTQLYGAYTSLVYASAVVGGLFADRLFNKWRSVFSGAVLIMAGHALLAVEGQFDPASGATQQAFFLALALIVTGTGLFKPNSTTLVGRLYSADDPRRTAGFYIFYVGINLGAVLAALICGWLGQAYGWSYGFGAAGVGMGLGLVLLMAFQSDLRPFASDGSRPRFISWIAIPVFIAAAWILVQSPVLTGWMLLAGLVCALAFIANFVATEASAAQKRHIGAALILIAAASVFWSLFEQAGSALNLFAERAVNLSFGPVTMVPTQTQFFNPFYILLLSPVFAWLWLRLRQSGREPSVTVKHGLGLLQVGLGFAVLVIGIRAAGSGDNVALWWLALAYLLHTTGELCLSPPAYEAMTRLAPPNLSGVVMGLWFYSLAIGNYIAALFAGHAVAVDAGKHADAFGRFPEVFGQVSIVAAIGGLAVLLLAPMMRKLTAGSGA